MLLIDPESGAIVDANPAASAYYGWTHEELLSKKIEEINTLTAEEVHAEMQLARAKTRNFFLFRHRRADGSIRDVEVYSGPLVLMGKTLLYSIVHDVTESKKAEKALQESEARLRAILDATPFPVALVDVKDENITYWSRSALTLFGHTAPTVGEWYQLAYPDPDYRSEVISRWKTSLEEARLSGQWINSGEYRVAYSDGSARICELYATFVGADPELTIERALETCLRKGYSKECVAARPRA
jgi:PAS domain S-box-containing protein